MPRFESVESGRFEGRALAPLLHEPAAEEVNFEALAESSPQGGVVWESRQQTHHLSVEVGWC
jgi:hypothetical protein